MGRGVAVCWQRSKEISEEQERGLSGYGRWVAVDWEGKTEDGGGRRGGCRGSGGGKGAIRNEEEAVGEARADPSNTSDAKSNDADLNDRKRWRSGMERWW